MNYIDVEGIVLAAGFSSRAGRNKLLLDIGGKPIIERCILSMYDSCAKIIVVGGCRIEDIRPLVTKYPKVELIFNPDFEEGMFSSVKKGLSKVTKERFFITLGDCPMISKNTYSEMLKIDENIIVPVFNGKRGHPVLMKSHFISEILSDNTLEAMRDFIKSRPFYRLHVEDEGILLDVDDMDDYFRLLTRQ
ncbi:MAG TPA: nucleotidyltransferase family protein [Clostridia bacterium]|nr:nucleotidyltransferase family protein [Clostridia bacterium]